MTLKILNPAWGVFDRPLGVHVVPIGDEQEHSLSYDCWCEPEFILSDESSEAFEIPVVKHNSADCREIIEQAEEIKAKVSGIVASPMMIVRSGFFARFVWYLRVILFTLRFCGKMRV